MPIDELLVRGCQWLHVAACIHGSRVHFENEPLLDKDMGFEFWA